MTLECLVPEGRNMSTVKDEEALYHNLEILSITIYIYNINSLACSAQGLRWHCWLCRAYHRPSLPMN